MDNAYIKSIGTRKKDQDKIDNKIKSKKNVEKLNITIPSDYKARLRAYCEKNYTTPAAFIRMCIDEFCNTP